MQRESVRFWKEQNKMARGRKPGTATETLEQQIEKAQEKVIKTKQAYDDAANMLQKLLDKRDAKRKEDLWNAIIKSEKSFDEILKFINTDWKNEED